MGLSSSYFERRAKMSDTKTNSTTNYPEVYPHGAIYAKEHGELAAYRESYRRNIECKKAIENAIRENFDGMHLNDGVVKPVLEEYGAERMGYVLSSTIQQKSWDMRFSRQNREWADQAGTSAGTDREKLDMVSAFMVESHPAILDGFVNMFREALKEREKAAAAAVEAAERYDIVELFAVPVLFSNGRISKEEVPDGMFRYDLRGSDYDPGHPISIEEHVGVNHAASILSPVAFPVREQGFLWLGDTLNFTGEKASVHEFQKEYGGVESETLTEKMENAICHENEDLFLTPIPDMESYVIYQIGEESAGKDYRFMEFDFINRKGIEVKGEDYSLVYGGLMSRQDNENTLYDKFNYNHPENYTGHSLSVSDVLVMNRDGEVRALYVDRFGFAELPDFVEQRLQMFEAKMEEQALDDYEPEIDDEEISTFSIYMYGEERHYKNTSGLDAEELCEAYAKCEKPFIEMAQYGEPVTEVAVAEIQQGHEFDFSVEFNEEKDQISIFDGKELINKSLSGTMQEKRQQTSEREKHAPKESLKARLAQKKDIVIRQENGLLPKEHINSKTL